MTTPTLFREYIWLVSTIYRARYITLSEINRRWMQTEMSGGTEFSRTTFYRHKCAIEDIFGIYIECDRKKGNVYYIGNDYVLRENSVQNWMLSTLSVSSLLSESMSLNERIILENVPSGGENLQLIIKAMKENRMLMFTYQRYKSAFGNSLSLCPYCIKLFRQRWYLLGRLSNGWMATFSLDRMKELKVMNSRFKMDKDFDAAIYFSDSYGIMVNEVDKPERVVIRAYEYEPYYLRDLPLHHSQREINTTDEYSDFELCLKLTSDFKTKLMSRGGMIKVLTPKSLAEELKDMHKNAIERYKNT